MGRHLNILKLLPLVVTFGLLALLTTYFFVSGITLYKNFYFTSDGFHYYSFIRNFSNFRSVYEGPTFEYLLGNHGYFALLLLSPIVFIFNSPLILLVVTITSHLLTALLLALCANKIIKHENSILISYLIALLYLIYPLVNKAVFSLPYLFQPDFLLPPFLVLLFYSALVSERFLYEFKTYIICLFIILIKEEYIILFPFFIFFTHLITMAFKGHNLSTVLVRQKELFKICFVLFCVSLFLISIILYYRGLNEINHAARVNFNFQLLKSTYTYSESFLSALVIILPILPIITTIFFSARKMFFILCSLFLTLITIARIILNYLVYGTSVGHMWANAMIAPFLFFIALLMLAVSNKKLVLPSIILSILLSFQLGISTHHNKYFNDWLYSNTYKLLTPPPPAKFNMLELKQISKLIDSKKNLRSYFICDEYMMSQFMERSHVSSGWLLSLDDKKRKEIILHSDFIILNKASELVKYLIINSADLKFHSINETANLIIFRKNQ